MSETVLLVGTLDTKGAEYAYLRERLRLHGVDTILADAGVNEPVGVEPDLHVGGDPAALARARDRGAAVTAMADAAEELARRLYAEGRIGGVLAAGGTGGTAIATRAMQALPVGAPKLMVSTMAAGNTADYVGASDVTMMASVTDVAGVNSISARILANAAAAMAGMMQAPPVELGETKPLVGATMFGVTTPCVTAARERMEDLGYEVLTFHATGAGGRALEGLMDSGFLQGVLDITTTELCDDLVGGVLSAGPDRLMRTTPEETAELGRRIARKLSAATGPTALFLPLRGVSMIDAEGQPFHDPEADEALFAALRDGLGDRVELVEMDCNVNDPEFAAAMADKLDEFMKEKA